MITFKTLKFKNIFSFGNTPVELDLTKNGRTLITGASGSGKSSMIVEAITFALYGKAFRKINKGDIVNIINNSGAEIIVDFTIGTKLYRVVRGQKPNIFEIYEDEKLVNQNPKARDYQKYLEESILGISYKTWTQIVVLGFANHTPFMTLSAGDRRQMVDEILGIEIFQRMNQKAKEQIQIDKQQTQSSTKEYDVNSNAIKQHKSVYKDLMTKKQQRTEEVEAEISELNKETEELDSEILNLKDILNEYVQNFPSFDENKLRTKLGSLNEYKYRIDQKHRSKKQYINLLKSNPICPTCKQEISEEFSSGIITKTQEEISECQCALDKIDESTKQINGYLEEMSKWNKSIDDIKRNIKDLRTKKQYISERIEDKKKSIEKTDDKDIIKNIASQIVELGDRNKEIKKELEEIQERLSIMMRCQMLLTDDGIKSKIIKLYLPMLNSVINEYLDKMDFTMRVELDEQFNETIWARFRDKMTFTQLSEGEKARVNVAMILAWRKLAELRNSARVSILVIDELLDSTLSISDVERLVHLFDDTEQNIFIISHRPEVVSTFTDATIRVEKRGNFSMVEFD